MPAPTFSDSVISRCMQSCLGGSSSELDTHPKKRTKCASATPQFNVNKVRKARRHPAESSLVGNTRKSTPYFADDQVDTNHTSNYFLCEQAIIALQLSVEAALGTLTHGRHYAVQFDRATQEKTCGWMVLQTIKQFSMVEDIHHSSSKEVL